MRIMRNKNFLMIRFPFLCVVGWAYTSIGKIYICNIGERNDVIIRIRPLLISTWTICFSSHTYIYLCSFQSGRCVNNSNNSSVEFSKVLLVLLLESYYYEPLPFFILIAPSSDGNKHLHLALHYHVQYDLKF